MFFELQEFITKYIKGAIAKAPFIFISIAFIFGIVVSHLFLQKIPHIVYFYILCSLSALIIILVKWIKQSVSILFLFWFILFGMFCSEFQKQNHTQIRGNQFITATIISQIQEKNKTYSAEIETDGENNSIAKAIIYLKKDSLSKQLKYGDVIEINARFSEIITKENSKFDYKKFMSQKYIYSSAYLSSSAWRKISHTNSLISWSFGLRDKILTIFQNSNIQQQNFDVLAALVFGDKSYLDTDIYKAFATTGAMHILSVSGLHVGIVATVLLFIFSFFKKEKYKIAKTIICIIGIWFYSCITGLCPSIQRSAIMFSLLSISIVLDRKTSTYNTLAAAAFISLLFTPNAIFDIGFQLSYLAVLGLLYFTPFIQNLFYFENKIYGYVWGIVAVSIAVQIITLPITFYYFSSFPTYSILTNIMVIPLSFIILILAIICIPFSAIPIVSDYVFKGLDISTSFLHNVIYDIVSFPKSKIPIHFEFKEMIVFYCFLIIGVFILEFNLYLRIQKQLIRI